MSRLRARILVAFALVIAVVGIASVAPVNASAPTDFQKRLTVGFVIGNDPVDSNPFFRGTFEPTSIVSQSRSGPTWWPITTSVLSGPASVSRLHTGVVRTGTITLTEVRRAYTPTKVSISAFDGWLTGSAVATGTTGFSGTFATADGGSGPLAALDDDRMARPGQRTAAEFPFIARFAGGPHAGQGTFGDFHVNQVSDTLVGGNFISTLGINTVIGDTDGHIVLLKVVGYGAMVAVPDTIWGLAVLGGSFTGPFPGDHGTWGSIKTVHLF